MFYQKPNFIVGIWYIFYIQHLFPIAIKCKLDIITDNVSKDKGNLKETAHFCYTILHKSIPILKSFKQKPELMRNCKLLISTYNKDNWQTEIVLIQNLLQLNNLLKCTLL